VGSEKRDSGRKAEQKVAVLDDRLEDLKRNSPASATETDDLAGESANDSDHDERNEPGWRKLFAAIDYKITTAQTELDILQRELNLGSVQYYPNLNTAMKESVTRKDINEHRKAIQEKKKEIAELKEQLDAVRGWVAACRRACGLGALGESASDKHKN
jgi:chromosome segregation ATPase